MGMPVVKVAAGGMPVVVATTGFGLPVTEATNGRGVPVTEATHGKGLPVSGITFAAAAPYVGPGNIVAGSRGFWGLRGYNFGYVDSPALDLHDAAGTFKGTVNILSTGALDTATAATLIAGGGIYVAKLYDQTGNSYHLTASLGKRPVLSVSGTPLMTFDGVDDAMTYAGSVSAPQGTTFSAVAKSVNNATQQNLLSVTGTGGDHQVGYNNSGAGNQIFLYSGNVIGATNADGSFHAIQAVFNGASSDLNTNGVAHTGDDGSNNVSAASFYVGATSGGSQFFKGDVRELGVWNTATFNGTQSSSMSANQHTYWGF